MLRLRQGDGVQTRDPDDLDPGRWGSVYHPAPCRFSPTARDGRSSMVPVSQPQPKPPSEDESEEFVAAALKVDPQGLSGKRRKDDEKKEEQPF